MRDKRKRVESAALAAVKASNPEDEVVVVNFNDEAFDDSEGFTNSMRKLEEALTKIDSRGGTAMRDALNMTIDFVRKKGKHDKKVILVVTDGNDTASTQVTLEKLVQKAHDTEVLMYFIGILNDEDKREAKRAKRAMEALAKASGGTAVFPETAEEVEKIAVAMAHEIRNQYIITYSPTNPALDGTFRTIRVAANGPKTQRVDTISRRGVVRIFSGASRRTGDCTPNGSASPIFLVYLVEAQGFAEVFAVGGAHGTGWVSRWHSAGRLASAPIQLR
jgi:VWFA-related protein